MVGSLVFNAEKINALLAVIAVASALAHEAYDALHQSSLALGRFSRAKEKRAAAQSEVEQKKATAKYHKAIKDMAACHTKCAQILVVMRQEHAKAESALNILYNVGPDLQTKDNAHAQVVFTRRAVQELEYDEGMLIQL